MSSTLLHLGWRSSSSRRLLKKEAFYTRLEAEPICHSLNGSVLVKVWLAVTKISANLEVVLISNNCLKNGPILKWSLHVIDCFPSYHIRYCENFFCMKKPPKQQLCVGESGIRKTFRHYSAVLPFYHGTVGLTLKKAQTWKVMLLWRKKQLRFSSPPHLSMQ